MTILRLLKPALIEHSSKNLDAWVLKCTLCIDDCTAACSILGSNYYCSVYILTNYGRINRSSCRRSIDKHIVKVLLSKLDKLFKLLCLKKLRRIWYLMSCKKNEHTLDVCRIYHFVQRYLTWEIMWESVYLSTALHFRSESSYKDWLTHIGIYYKDWLLRVRHRTSQIHNYGCLSLIRQAAGKEDGLHTLSTETDACFKSSKRLLHCITLVFYLINNYCFH